MIINFLNKKTVTLIISVFLFLAIILTTFLAQHRNIFQSGAGPSETPVSVEITNVSDTSFTVSYTTDAKVLGTINSGANNSNLDEVTLDDRDRLTQTVNKYNVHSISVNDLSPNTNYYFQITSGDKQYGNNGSLYIVKTGNPISSPPLQQNPLAGKIIEPNGSPPQEALIYLKTNGAQTLSTLAKSDGSYVIPLNALRNNSLSNYFPLSPNTNLSMEARTQTENAKVIILANQINPVPQITLSNTYNFSSANSVGELTPIPTINQTGTFPKIGQTRRSFDVKNPTPTFAQTITPTPIPFNTNEPTSTPQVTNNTSVIMNLIHLLTGEK